MRNEHDIERINRENFRNSLDALARPGKQQIITPLFGSGLLAMASVLLYAEVTYCYQGDLDFHLIKAVCGAKSAPAAEADYLFFDTPDPDFLFHSKTGTAENPEFSATLVFGYSTAESDNIDVNLSGPGINGRYETSLPIDKLFVDTLKEKNQSFPMGIDLFIIGEDNILIGLPRTTQIEVLS